jgi:hypothetical protein
VPGLGESGDDDREIVAAITVAEGTCIQGTDGDSPESVSLGVYSRSKHQGDAVSQRGVSITSHAQLPTRQNNGGGIYRERAAISWCTNVWLAQIK